MVPRLFDARVALVGDRSDTFFDKAFPDPYFIRSFQIAIKIGDQWRVYSPADTYVPLGMLPWQEEAQQTLLSDPREPVWITTPLSPPEKSLVTRSARLKLSEDGTLEGDVHIEYSGHLAVQRKELGDDDSPTEREETLRTSVKALIRTAELSNIQIENVTDPIKPLSHSYHIRIPNYAQRTSKRLFLQPAFFQHGAEPVFSASVRKYDIYFHYPWSERDEVLIDLPAGFSLDRPDIPLALRIDKVSQYQPTLTAEGNRIVYRREFLFGSNNSILFPVDVYDRLKKYFGNVHRMDSSIVTVSATASDDK